jgi:chromosome segregation protein
MHLKKLQLHGFKTFADKTEIDFSQGVTAVVGPNGSGKSNIADAMLWVLGEQKASAVRGTSAKDVIFSGSDKRRPMGMAEVSLTVDNSDGKLPVEFGEVTITRRAYRTGEGEYFINKVPCRLKDIYELFLDTGVGREAYSLVNQSEIDAVLSVNPEDRRGLFEEAAGIKKYRVKKREALRKLDSTETNLQRVRDILGEIDGRIEPLKLEAERATHYNRLKERLQQIESTLLIVDLRKADSELNSVRAAKAAEQEKAIEQEEAILEARVTATELAEKLAEADAELETWREAYQKALSDAERSESQRALAAQRVAGLEASLGLLAQELESLAARRERLLGEIAQVQAELSGASQAEGGHKSQVTEQQARVQELNQQINELTRQAERRRAEANQLARLHAARQADLARAEARVAEIEVGLPSLREEAERLQALAAQRAEESQSTRDAVTTAKAQLEEAEKALATTRETHDSTRQALHSTQQERHTLHSKTVALASRLRALQDLENAQEGYYAGVKAVMDAVKKGHVRGNFKVVADAFSIPAGYEVAFETALGGSVQDIITDSESEAKAAISYLHESQRGRATFLPLDRMRPSGNLDLGRANGMRGVLGGALDLIDFDPKYRPALETLLGRVILCNDLDSATECSRVARGWSRIVTMTGEVVSPSGALTGGRQQGRNAGQLLGRKTEIATLSKDLKACEAEEAKCQKRLTDLEEKREQMEQALAETQSAKQAAQLAANEAQRKSEFAVAEARRAQEQADQALRKADVGQNTLAQAKAQAATAAEALQSAGLQTADADDAIAAEAQLLSTLAAERDSLNAEVTTARIGLATQSEKVSNLSRTLRTAQAEVEQVDRQLAHKQEQSRQASEERDSLVAQSAVRDAEVVRAAEAKAKAHEGLQQHTEERQELAEQAREASQALRELEESRASALETIHKSELREARLDMQRTQLAVRLLEEYEMEAEDAIALEEDPEVTDGSPQEVARLRREIKGMGDVNTGAIEEYEEVSTRFEFLTTQRADLEEAREKLLAAIKDIDDSTREVFLDTFKAVGVAFNELFTRLFRGGHTDLVLTKPDDILETGIDIMVQPPGKKRQNLALLSGGERALTAAALLFAFLKIKPSPFVVMDEVDAPLDGANVERFAELLKEFGERSQFIIITHNPTTMEAAPIWYGVTMQEPGISHILSMHVPHLEPEPNGSNGSNGANGHHANGHKPEALAAV